jgi:hypothetical protein
LKITSPRFLFPALLLLIASPGFSQNATAEPSYRMLDQWGLSDAGSWGRLKVDTGEKRLYIPRTGYVAVVDLGTGKLLGKIAGFQDARAVALDDKRKYGYATDMLPGPVGYVRVFDRSAFKVVASIQVCAIPSAIIFDPVTSKVFAFSVRGRNMVVIDPATDTVAATMPLPGKPHLALTDGKGSIYVSFRGIGKLLRIDTATRRIAADWSTNPCAEFHGMALDAANRQLLGTCYPRQMIAVDADSGKVSLIGESAFDAADLAFDPERHLLFSGSASGVLSVYRQESAMKYNLEQQLSAPPRSGTLTVDPATGRVLLATSEFAPAPVGPGMEEQEAQLAPLAGTFRVIVVGR